MIMPGDFNREKGAVEKPVDRPQTTITLRSSLDRARALATLVSAASSDMPGTLPLPNTSGRCHAPQTIQTLSMLERVSASFKRLNALDDLMAVVQSTLREGRFDDEASSRILIAAGAAVNAMRAEREAISQTQKPAS